MLSPHAGDGHLLFFTAKKSKQKKACASSYTSMLRLFKSDPIVMISSFLRAITMGTPV